MAAAARSSPAEEYNRSYRSEPAAKGYLDPTRPYPMHSFPGPQSSAAAAGIARAAAAAAGIARDSLGPSAGGFLHPGGDGGGGGGGVGPARHLGSSSSSNMGVMSATSSPPARAPPSRREGYADVAVARQCEREGCSVQPSYGKVWKKVSRGDPLACLGTLSSRQDTTLLLCAFRRSC